MIDEPIHVTDAAFQKTVIENTLPVIVDFWAPWCHQESGRRCSLSHGVSIARGHGNA